MARRKSDRPEHYHDLSERRNRSSSPSRNTNENRTYTSSSNRNSTTTATRTSTRSTRESSKHEIDACRNRTKKRTGYMFCRIRHLNNVLQVTRKTFRQMRYLQRSTRNMLPRLPFQRVVREIMQDFCEHGQILRIQTAALHALQEAAEMYVTQIFEDSYFCTLHANRKTLRPTDIQCVRRIRGLDDVINH